MKKIIIIIIGFLLLESCTSANLDNSVENPSRFTTHELLSLPRDTVVMTTNNNIVFFVIEDELVVRRMHIVNDSSLVRPKGKMILINIFVLVIGFIMGAAAVSQITDS